VSQLSDADFQPALLASQVRANRLVLVEVGLERIVLTRLDGQVCAFNALCPHQLGNLDRGFLNNGEIECPVHGWRFNIRNGQSVYPEDDGLRLRRYPVKDENGMLYVSLQPLKPSDTP
jgi:naphthalene 1,2-dioxygenase system ferredoxin subunit